MNARLAFLRSGSSVYENGELGEEAANNEGKGVDNVEAVKFRVKGRLGYRRDVGVMR